MPRSKNGVTSFEFPFTPLARRIYNEEEDREMDIWINIKTRALDTRLEEGRQPAVRNRCTCREIVEADLVAQEFADAGGSDSLRGGPKQKTGKRKNNGRAKTEKRKNGQRRWTTDQQ